MAQPRHALEHGTRNRLAQLKRAVLQYASVQQAHTRVRTREGRAMSVFGYSAAIYMLAAALCRSPHFLRRVHTLIAGRGISSQTLFTCLNRCSHVCCAGHPRVYPCHVSVCIQRYSLHVHCRSPHVLRRVRFFCVSCKASVTPCWPI